jgi:hypothetical protein
LRAELPRSLAFVAVAASGLAISWQRLWEFAGSPTSFFGGDLTAYIMASRRLVETGSPYSTEVLSGPIANIPANIPIAYLYPPPWSQLFVPLSHLDRLDLAPWYVLAHVVALVAVLPMLIPKDERTVVALAGMLALVAWSYPLHFALYGGNVSALVVVAVAAALWSGPAGFAIAGTTAAVVKLTPAPMLLAALFMPSTRSHAIRAGAAIVGISIAANPAAWADWVKALPNILATETNLGPGNFSPAAIGIALGVPEVGRLFGYMLVLGFLLMTIHRSINNRPIHQIVAAAMGAATFASSTMWDHYLAVLVPLNIYAWFTLESRALRLLIFASALVGIGQWFGTPIPASHWYRLAVTGLAAANFALLATAHRRARSLVPPPPANAST